MMKLALCAVAFGSHLTFDESEVVSVTSYPGSRADPNAGSSNSETDIARERAWNVQGDVDNRYLEQRAVTIELSNGDRFDVMIPDGKNAEQLAQLLKLTEVRADSRGRCREWRRVSAVVTKGEHTFDAAGRRLVQRAPAPAPVDDQQ